MGRKDFLCCLYLYSWAPHVAGESEYLVTQIYCEIQKSKKVKNNYSQIYYNRESDQGKM